MLHRLQYKISSELRESLNESKARMLNDTHSIAPIACRMDALTPSQRERRSALQNELRAVGQEASELADGYAFRFRAESKTILTAAEFISLERLCYPFFKFEQIVESEADTLWLRIQGRDGIKEFIRTELAFL